MDTIRWLNKESWVLPISEIQVENDIHSRFIIENSLKLEADLCGIEPLKKDATQLNVEVERLRSRRHKLSGRFKHSPKDLAGLQADNKKLPALRVELEGLHQELMHARVTIDYEKKGSIELMDQKQAIVKNLVSVAREVEKLQAELLYTDARSWGGSYRTSLDSSEGGYSQPYSR